MAAAAAAAATGRKLILADKASVHVNNDQPV
jgi:hypothetical protein